MKKLSSCLFFPAINPAVASALASVVHSCVYKHLLRDITMREKGMTQTRNRSRVSW